MSDDKQDISTDLSEDLSTLVKKRSTKRPNNDIYERFISRVQSAEQKHADKDSENQNSDQPQAVAPLKPLETADTLPAYEPLSSEELSFFESTTSTPKDDTSDADNSDVDSDRSDKNSDNHLSNTPLDDSATHNSLTEERFVAEAEQITNVSSIPDTPTLAHQSETISPDIATIEPNTEIEPHPEPEKNSAQPQASSKKPLIVGIILGSLLIAAVVLALIFTGILSTAPSDSTDNVDSNSTASTTDSTEADTVNEIEDGATADINSTSTAPASKTEAPTATDITSETPVPSLPDNSENAAPANEDTQTPTDNADSPDDSGLTYEDFRQESQSTLYRETDN